MVSAPAWRKERPIISGCGGRARMKQLKCWMARGSVVPAG